MNINDLNRLLSVDYVAKVVYICADSKYPQFNEATLKSITYSPKLVTLELNINDTIDEIPIWLDQFTNVVIHKTEKDIYLRVENLTNKYDELSLKFYLIPHIAKVDLSLIYNEH